MTRPNIRIGPGSGSVHRASGSSGIPPSRWGLAKQAPLTPEYQAVLEASLADQAAGGQGGDNLVTCRTNGMPRMMSVAWPIEFVILQNITYVNFHPFLPRRIYTDGRKWPEEIEPSFAGYSIGKWLDTDGDGRFDTLEVETRDFKGPRTFERERPAAARRQ